MADLLIETILYALRDFYFAFIDSKHHLAWISTKASSSTTPQSHVKPGLLREDEFFDIVFVVARTAELRRLSLTDESLKLRRLRNLLDDSPLDRSAASIRARRAVHRFTRCSCELVSQDRR